MKQDTREKIAALFLELPWLKKLAHESRVCTVRVERVDEDMLNIRVGWIMSEDLLSDYFDKIVYLVDRGGGLLMQVGVSEIQHPGNPGARWWQVSLSREPWVERVHFCERVGDAVIRLGEKAGQVAFIVTIDGQSLTVSKKPNNLTIPALVDKVVASHRDEFRAALDEVK